MIGGGLENPPSEFAFSVFRLRRVIGYTMVPLGKQDLPEVDRLVNELYDLTPEEIKLVEGAQ